MVRYLQIAVTLAACWASLASARADDLRQGGKLLLTDGVTSVEGAAGGGLASWATIAGNETDAGIGATAHITAVRLPEFDLTTFGAAVGVFDRIELSYARHAFDTRDAGAALGLGRGFTFRQDVFGAKLRVIGDAVWDQDILISQIAIGVQHKRADQGAVIRAVGGKEHRGTDFYVAATKVLLAQSAVVNATVRFTKANQFGLLGFGGDKQGKRTAQFEGSAGMLLTSRLLVGAEYRTKPDNLGFAREQDSVDAFAAWGFTRNLTLTVAYADLGDIATVRKQRGLFASLQAGF